MLTLRLLGGFEALWDGVPVALTSRPAQSLLAYLALNAGRAPRREQLAGLLWPHDAETAARANLRQVVWRIRKVLPEVIVADNLTLAFNPAAPHWVDALLLHAPAPTLEAQRAAVEAYRGELLPGFYEDWITPERERLAALADDHARHYLTALCANGAWAEALPQAERWVSLMPAAEHPYQTLMRAHAARGDLATMRAVYQRCEETLARELSAAPSPETTVLRAELLATPHPPAAPTALPAPLTTFIGRARELAQLETLLSERRLITLTGAGGTGKTRLAHEATRMAQQQQRFPGGGWWVELAPLTDPAAVTQAIAEALSITETPARPLLKAITDALTQTQTPTLLILDNCEHVLEACVTLVAQLLRACPRLVLLTTSREALNLAGELVMRVPSLAVPDPVWAETAADELLQYDAVRLFCDRAEATGNFTTSPAALRAVGDICRRLDGIPLALELAAAQTAWLTPAHIAARLDEMFALLSEGNRAALPRQRTLHATIAWSYALLSETERALLARLSVFAGGWTLDSVEAVCGPASALPLRALVHKSLVGVDEERYRLLEPIRQFAREQLHASGAVARLSAAHAQYFARWAEALATAAPEFARQLDSERDNLRAALAWAIEHQQTTSGPFAATVGRLWFARATHALTESNPRLHARALYASGLLIAAQGEAAQARYLFQQSLALAQRAEDTEASALAQYELDKLPMPNSPQSP